MISKGAVNELAFSIPAKCVSAWSVETDPELARQWLASLPLADSAETGRELYQALYTLNRQDLDPHQRFALMELYQGPLADVARRLQSHYSHAALPLSPKRHQLVAFVRQLHMEMAHGYKCCLYDLAHCWKPWVRRKRRIEAVERALHYLGEVLVDSYLAYLPSPPGVWREIHGLYRYAESLGEQHEPIRLTQEGAAVSLSVTERYLRLLLLGLSQPYQLPRHECLQVRSLLERHAAQARLTTLTRVSSPAGCFVVDLCADAPPFPYPRGEVLVPDDNRRLLDALGLVHRVHGFMRRLQQGEQARHLDLGIECLDAACQDLLRRLMRAWGVPARRRHGRLRRRGQVFVCVGIPTIHFFASGQRPFAPPDAVSLPPAFEASGEGLSSPAPVADTSPSQRTSYRVDRWQVRDISPRGLLLARVGERGAPVRVGEVVGIQEVRDPGRWSAACVRWLRCPEPEVVEMGVELLAPQLRPVAVRRLGAVGRRRQYAPALLLPALPAARRPASLLVARNTCPENEDLELLEDTAAAPRRVRALRLLERSGSFEQHVVTDVAP